MTKKTTALEVVAPVTRSTAGLAEAMFEEFDALRSGKSNPTRANASAKIVTTILDTARLEMEMHKHAKQFGDTVERPPVAVKRSLQLGLAE